VLAVLVCQFSHLDIPRFGIFFFFFHVSHLYVSLLLPFPFFPLLCDRTCSPTFSFLLLTFPLSPVHPILSRNSFSPLRVLGPISSIIRAKCLFFFSFEPVYGWSICRAWEFFFSSSLSHHCDFKPPPPHETPRQAEETQWSPFQTTFAWPTWFFPFSTSFFPCKAVETFSPFPPLLALVLAHPAPPPPQNPQSKKKNRCTSLNPRVF